jgi:hypothetical protein
MEMGDVPRTVITFWPRGYADENGLTAVAVPGHVSRDEAQQIIRQGPMRSFASVWAVVHYPKPEVKPLTPEERAYWSGDNS